MHSIKLGGVQRGGKGSEEQAFAPGQPMPLLERKTSGCAICVASPYVRGQMGTEPGSRARLQSFLRCFQWRDTGSSKRH